MNNQNWWDTEPQGAKDNTCVYCGLETSADSENLEHVIPESLGNTETLYRGAVCNKCNQRLGENVDSKFFLEPLFAVGQVATKTPGKKGIRDEIGIHVKRQTDESVSLSGNCGVENQYVVSRALAKCAVNILTKVYGSNIVRNRVSDLISYVKAPKNKSDVWPFAALYSLNAKITVAFWYKEIVLDDQMVLVVMFSCPSGLFAIPCDRISIDHSRKLMDLINADVQEKENEKNENLVNTVEFWAQRNDSC